LRYYKKYANQGYFQEIDLPQTKDWNSDLMAGIPYFLSEQNFENEDEWEG